MGPSVSADSSPSSAESNFRELEDVFLQTQTRIWLGEVLHTRLDEKLNISDLLADGELLLDVSNVIWNMLLVKCVDLRHAKAHKYKPVGSSKSSGRYMPYSNVDSFLKICKILGLNGIDLFSPSDVVEKKEIRKVCICIRSFSKKARSKKLNVPDFDIVTCTVTMPTNMVGGIRRSLETSQYSSTSYSSYSPCGDSRLKFRQEKFSASCERNYESCSEDSDDAEGEAQSCYSSSIKNYSTSSVNLDFENSPGVYNTSTQRVLESDIQDRETYGYEQGQYKAVESLCAECDMNDDQRYSNKSQQLVCDKCSLHANNGVRFGHANGAVDYIDGDLDLTNDASVVGDSLDDNMAGTSYIPHQLALSDLTVSTTDINDLVLSDEESVINLCTGPGSIGENSHHEFRGIFSDDVEVSSRASLSSVLGDDQFDTADDFNNSQVTNTELQSCGADADLEKKSMRGYESQVLAKYETPVYSLTPQLGIMKLQNFSFTPEYFSPCWDDCQSYAIEYRDVESFGDEISMCTRDLGDVLRIESTNEAVRSEKDIDELEICATMPELDHPSIREDRCDNMVDITYGNSDAFCENTIEAKGTEERHSSLEHQETNSLGTDTPNNVALDNAIVNHNFVVPPNQPVEKHGHLILTKAINDEDILHYVDSTSKDETKHNDAGVVGEEISDSRELTGAGQARGCRAPLLRRIAKGTALVGVLFFLLHLRIRSERDKTHKEASAKSSQTLKSNGVEFCSRNGRKGGITNEIYPAEKLKFGD